MSEPAGYVLQVEPLRWIARGGIRVETLNLAKVYRTRHGAKVALGQERSATGAEGPFARIQPVVLRIFSP